MNHKKILAFILVMAMCCMMAFGQARDPKTGRFVSTKKKPGASAAWNKAHPRDAKTGKFIKKSAVVHKGSMMMGHPKAGTMMMGHKSTMMPHKSGHMMMTHKMPMMAHSTKVKPVAKKGIMSKIKSMMHKKKS